MNCDNTVSLITISSINENAKSSIIIGENDFVNMYMEICREIYLIKRNISHNKFESTESGEIYDESVDEEDNERLSLYKSMLCLSDTYIANRYGDEKDCLNPIDVKLISSIILEFKENYRLRYFTEKTMQECYDEIGAFIDAINSDIRDVVKSPSADGIMNFITEIYDKVYKHHKKEYYKFDMIAKSLAKLISIYNKKEEGE